MQFNTASFFFAGKTIYLYCNKKQIMHRIEKLLIKAGFKNIEYEETHDEESTISFKNEVNSAFNIVFDHNDKVIFFTGLHHGSIYDLHDILYNYDDELTLHTIDFKELNRWIK